MNFNLLEKLSTAVGISGDEGIVRDIIINEIKAYVDSLIITPLGNIIATKSGENTPKKKLMLSAHMDEVGMIINDIDDKGFISFLTVGGIDSAILLGKSVFINGKISGVIGGKPVHLMHGDEFEKSVPIDKLTVDIGASSKEEAEKFVQIGDYINFAPFFELSRGTIKGKALDDRIGCLLLVELIKTELAYDTTFVFSTQEEVGLRGAQTASNIVKPDIVIAVEGTVAGDVLDIKGAKTLTKLGKGPAVSIIDSGTVYDKEYFKLAFKIAKELGISCQPRTSAAGANDAGAAHKAGHGARAIAVSVPCRYIHCPISMASIKDAEDAFLLLESLIEKVHD